MTKFRIQDWISLKMGRGDPPIRWGPMDDKYPKLNLGDYLSAWLTTKTRMKAEINRYKIRLNALMSARTEALSNALLFENQDITRWLQEISSKGSGALGVEIMELREANKELVRRNTELAPSERRAWEAVDAILEAWEHSAGIRSARRDPKTEEWIPDIKSPILPPEVCAAIKAWLNRPDQ